MRDIRWDKIMLAEFRSLVFLTEDEDRVLTGWAHDKSITWMSMEYNLSDRTISTILSRLRSLYDQVQPFTPLLPPRNVPGKPESPSRNGRGYFLSLKQSKTFLHHQHSKRIVSAITPPHSVGLFPPILSSIVSDPLDFPCNQFRHEVFV